MMNKKKQVISKNNRDKIQDDYNFIIQKVMDYRIAKIILVANYFDIFTLIEKESNKLDRICSLLKTDKRATEMLLDSLVAVKLLKKNGIHYNTTKVSKKYLVKGQPSYKGDNLKYQELIWDCWTDLKKVIKTGHPSNSLEELLSKQGNNFVKNYIDGMDNIARGPAAAISNIIDFSRIRKMLDVGGGPGTYSIRFAKQNPHLEAFILDLPLTLAITRENISDENLNNRVKVLEGNYLSFDFGRGYDLIFMSHITHNEGEDGNRLLFQKAYKALNPGGFLAVHDFVIGENRTEPLFPAIFSINVLVYTRKGRTYSWNEYKKWVKKEGFSKIRRFEILPHLNNHSSLILGQKLP